MTTSQPSEETRLFPSTPGGAVALGRKRLRRALGGVLILMLGVALFAFFSGRFGAGLIALVAAIGPLFSLGLFGETDLDGLVVGRGVLAIKTSSEVERIQLAGGSARRLEAEEIAHIERLASHAGVVTGTGGYDSARLGVFDLYAADLDHAVLVEAAPLDEEDPRRVVVTPDDPEAFLQALGRYF